MSSKSEVKLDAGFIPQELTEAICENGTLRCVFSTADLLKVGTGTTTRKHVTKQYYYVLGIGDNMFSIRLVNDKCVPFGEGKIIELDTLKDRYTLELDFFESEVAPAMEKLEDYLDDGDEHREDGQFYSAEECYNKALGMDEKNLRALFSLGLVYLELEDSEKATDMMEAILKVQSAFDGKNEHLFNEFGISLRKAGMINEAVEYYTQAVNYAKNDENLFYNLARANYERSAWEECVEALERCYALAPNMKPAADLLNIIQQLADKAELRERMDKAPVPRSVAQRINRILSDGDTPTQKKDKKAKAQKHNTEYEHSPKSTAKGRARSGDGPYSDSS